MRNSKESKLYNSNMCNTTVAAQASTASSTGEREKRASEQLQTRNNTYIRQEACCSPRHLRCLEARAHHTTLQHARPPALLRPQPCQTVS